MQNIPGCDSLAVEIRKALRCDTAISVVKKTTVDTETSQGNQ